MYLRLGGMREGGQLPDITEKTIDRPSKQEKNPFPMIGVLFLLKADLNFESINLVPHASDDGTVAWHDLDNPYEIFEADSDKLKNRVRSLVDDLIGYLGDRMLSITNPNIYSGSFRYFLSCSPEEATGITSDIEGWLALNKIKYWRACCIDPDFSWPPPPEAGGEYVPCGS